MIRTRIQVKRWWAAVGAAPMAAALPASAGARSYATGRMDGRGFASIGSRLPRRRDRRGAGPWRRRPRVQVWALRFAARCTVWSVAVSGRGGGAVILETAT